MANKKQNNWLPYLTQGLLFMGFLIIGVLGAWYFVSTERVAPKRERRDVGILVQAESFKKGMHNITLESTGEVIPSRLMPVRSEVSGRIQYAHPQIFPGGRVKKGDVLFKIAPRDYELGLSNAKINLRQKELALLLEQARGRSAESELAVLLNSFEQTALDEEEEALVKRQPQLQEAIAAVEAAKNNVELAQIMLQRSTIKAPFDAIIEDNPFGVGDYVSGQNILTNVIAIDKFWVKIALYPSYLKWIAIPGINAEQGSEVDVAYEMGGETIRRKGTVHSLLGGVNTLGRMLQILVEVDAPFGTPEERPLLLGTYVKASIHANMKIEAIAVPRSFIREGDKLHVFGKDSRLIIREVDIAHKSADTAFITGGLNEDEPIISTLMTAPVEGRKLRSPEQGENTQKQKGRSNTPNKRKPNEQI